MPNIKSSIRSVKTDAERRARNFAVRSQVRTAIRKSMNACQTNPDEAQSSLSLATSVIDKAVSKGVIHKNTAARKKSRLAKKLAQAKQ